MSLIVDAFAASIATLFFAIAWYNSGWTGVAVVLGARAFLYYAAERIRDIDICVENTDEMSIFKRIVKSGITQDEIAKHCFLALGAQNALPAYEPVMCNYFDDEQRELSSDEKKKWSTSE